MEDKVKANLVCIVNDESIEDSDLTSIGQPFIIGQFITESEKDIEVEYEYDQKIIRKKIRKQNVKKLILDSKELDSAELNTVKGINPLDCLINITNRIASKKYFNFVDEGLLLLYENYLSKDFNKFVFSNLNDQTEFNYNEKCAVLSSIMKSYDVAHFDEIYMKVIDENLKRSDNVLFFFLSNQMKNRESPSNNSENIGYLIKSLSVYNKVYYPTNYFENSLDQNSSFYLLDKLSQAIQLLEIFGSSSIPIKDKQTMLVLPNYLYNIKIYYNRKHLVPRSAKITIIAFNKFFLDLIGKKPVNHRNFTSFYALLRGADNDLLDGLDLVNKVEAYKLLNKTENINWEIKEDIKNFNSLNQLLRTFNFTNDDITHIHRTLALILHISNIEFEKNTNNEIIGIKNMKPFYKVMNIKEAKIMESLEKTFTYKISVNSQQMQTLFKLKQEEGYNNLNMIIRDLYEKLFMFIVEKINKTLFNESVVSKQTIEDKLFKEVSIIDISNNSNCFSRSNLFDLLHFYYSEKSYNLIQKVKIDNVLNIYKNARFNFNKLNYIYDQTFDNILSFFESSKNGFLKLLHEHCLSRKLKDSEFYNKLETNKTVAIYNNNNVVNLNFKHLDGDYTFNLNELIQSNLMDVNYNLISILDIMVNIIKSPSDELLKIFLQEKGLNTYTKQCIDNFKGFLEENESSYKFFVYYIPQSNFETNLDELMKKPKSLVAFNQIRKIRIESYVENILNKFNKFMSYKEFCIRYELLYNNIKMDKPSDISKLDESDGSLVVLVNSMIKGINIEKNGVFFGENNIILMNNYAYNILEEKLASQNKLTKTAGQKLISIFKMIQIKKHVKRLTDASLKIQTNFRKKLVEMSKKYLSICQYKIHFWFLARIKRIRMKKLRINVIKIQRIVRAFIRRKFRTSSNVDKIDYKSWNLDDYIKEQEKKVKPTIPYGKFDFSSYVSEVLKSAVDKSDKTSVSEFIKEEQYEEIRKKNIGNFNPMKYIGSIIKNISQKVQMESKIESELKSLLNSENKTIEKKDQPNRNHLNLNDKNNNENKKLHKQSEKKEDNHFKQDTKRPLPKNEITNKFGHQEKLNNKSIKDTKKHQSKLQENEKKKSENLNIIREEIRAEDSEKKEPSSEDKILRIQGKWKSNRASRWIDVMREKVFIIQRNFRKLLIKKYDLPDNYFYNEVFLRKQLEIFENNVMENMKVLFPAIFENEQDKAETIEVPDEENKKEYSKSKITKQKYKNEEINLKTQSKLLTDKSFVNSSLKNEINKTSIVHNPYEDGKIHLFANILDIDFMVETDEIYEKLWASSYQKIFTHCLNSNAPLQLLSLGTSHTICLSNKGKAYSFGWNNFGQCGVPVKSTIISKKDLDEETEEEKRKKAEYTVSKNLKVINKVEGMKIPQIEELLIAKSVACGEDHTLLLDHEGEIWCFGINLNGQLGLGHKNLVEKPSKLTALSKLKITTIKTEGEVNFAVSGFGDAYMWPWNDKNKLRYDPLKISLKNEKVSTVSCGNNFVLLLCQSGKVYSMGKTNNYGQLGLGDTHPRYRPSLIEFFVVNQERVTQISCGYKHAACKTSTGRVYTWGLGVKGQLAHGDFNNYSLPHQVVFDNNQFNKGLQVACGFRSTFFLLENRKIYFSGCTSNTFMQNYPTIYNYIQKIPELKNESSYSIVRILTTWTKSFSVLYATIADSTTLKISPMKLNSILNNLASKWDNEYGSIIIKLVDPPYINTIAGYFSTAYMKKPHK